MLLRRRLLTRLSSRRLSTVPRASELATIQDVVAAHAQHRTEYDHILLSVSWSKLGRLVRTETKAAREVRRDQIRVEVRDQAVQPRHAAPALDRVPVVGRVEHAEEARQRRGVERAQAVQQHDVN